MITEQELKDKCTPEFIKWLCEYAKGFEIMFETTDGIVAFRLVDNSRWYSKESTIGLSVLIHRAVEGWNKDGEPILIANNKVVFPMTVYPFSKYQSQSLTQAECAILHCLLDVFEDIS